MPGQSVIVAVGGIGFPPEYAGMDAGELSRLGLSPVMTVTSTYDHRVIQGAESGEFLKAIAEMLQGEHGFYDEVFQSLGLHTPPFRGTSDSTPSLGKPALGAGVKSSKIEKQARVYELIRAYRVRGHLLADTNPLGYEPRNHTELDPASYGLTVWDLDRSFLTGGMAGVGGGLAGKSKMTLRDILDTLWDTYTGHVGSEFMHLSSPEEKAVGSSSASSRSSSGSPSTRHGKSASSRSSTRPRRWSSLSTPSTSATSGFPWKGRRP